MLTFHVPGDLPIKRRPRFTKTGHTYTDSRTTVDEARILSAYRKCPDRPKHPHDGPVMLGVTATALPPQSWPLWKRKLAAIWPHIVKPDFDNVAKAIADALEGHAYVNDSQITEANIVKQYGANPGVTVTLAFGSIPERS